MPTPTYYKGKRVVSDRTAKRIPTVLPVLGTGSYRTVFDMGNVVVKITDTGWTNKKEAEIWEKVKGTKNERFFAAVHACAEDGSWLVMDKKSDTRPSYAECDAFWKDNCDKWAKLGLKFDAHPGNIRIENGNPIWIDYGY